MTAWTRLACSLSCAAVLAASAPALAQKTPAQQAERLNEEGKRLFAEKRYEEAYRKFFDAAALSPEGRYFFNMCYALNFLERYADAIQACEQVEPAGADEKLKEKTRRALASLREKLAAQQAAQGGGAGDPGGGDPGNGGSDPGAGGGDPGAGGGAYPPPGGGAPPPSGPDPFIAGQASGPVDSYKWSIGGEVGLIGNLGMGESPAGDRLYGAGGANLRLFANFIVNESQRLGVQGYLGFAGLPPTDENEFDQGLAMADLGAAVFMHRPLTGHIYWTPLLGAHIAIQQPQERSQAYLAFGARAEVGFSYVFGLQGEHALSITPGLNLYFPAGGEIDGVGPEEYGFDRTRGTFSINAGYTFRFSTPFGSTPLITLE